MSPSACAQPFQPFQTAWKLCKIAMQHQPPFLSTTMLYHRHTLGVSTKKLGHAFFMLHVLSQEGLVVNHAQHVQG